MLRFLVFGVICFIYVQSVHAVSSKKPFYKKLLDSNVLLIIVLFVLGTILLVILLLFLCGCFKKKQKPAKKKRNKRASNQQEKGDDDALLVSQARRSRLGSRRRLGRASRAHQRRSRRHSDQYSLDPASMYNLSDPTSSESLTQVDAQSQKNPRVRSVSSTKSFSVSNSSRVNKVQTASSYQSSNQVNGSIIYGVSPIGHSQNCQTEDLTTQNTKSNGHS